MCAGSILWSNWTFKEPGKGAESSVEAFSDVRLQMLAARQRASLLRAMLQLGALLPQAEYIIFHCVPVYTILIYIYISFCMHVYTVCVTKSNKSLYRPVRFSPLSHSRPWFE